MSHGQASVSEPDQRGLNAPSNSKCARALPKASHPCEHASHKAVDPTQQRPAQGLSRVQAGNTRKHDMRHCGTSAWTNRQGWWPSWQACQARFPPPLLPGARRRPCMQVGKTSSVCKQQQGAERRAEQSGPAGEQSGPASRTLTSMPPCGTSAAVCSSGMHLARSGATEVRRRGGGGTGKRVGHRMRVRVCGDECAA